MIEGVYRANATFDTSRSEYPVTNYHTEEDLQAFLEKRPVALRLTVGRIKVPRIMVGPINWPPSERVMREIREIRRKHEAGEISDPMSLFADLYQGSLSMLFEPIWPDHPMLKMMRREKRTEESERGEEAGASLGERTTGDR